jgi:hypothetical protein
MTDEDLRMWAVEQSLGDLNLAQRLVAFVRPVAVDAPAAAPMKIGEGRKKWTSEMEAFISARRREGLSWSAIPRLLNAKFGANFTTSAVRGQGIRIGVPSICSERQMAHLQRMRDARRAKVRQRNEGPYRGGGARPDSTQDRMATEVDSVLAINV